MKLLLFKKVIVVVLCKYKLERIVKWVKLGVYKIYIIEKEKKSSQK